MLIVFGVRSVHDLLAEPIYTCEQCGNHAKHQVTSRSRRLTLFFIPVCRIGAAHYLDTCTVCGRTITLSKTQAEGAAIPPITPPATPPGPQDAPTWTPHDR